ncbi:MAG: hypothetical protein AAFR53_14085 [Pseudomonadota bacterium]
MKRVFIATYIVAGLLVLGAMGFSKLSDLAWSWFSDKSTAYLNDLRDLPTRYETEGRPIVFDLWNIPEPLVVEVLAANQDGALEPYGADDGGELLDTVVVGAKTWQDLKGSALLDELPVAPSAIPSEEDVHYTHTQIFDYTADNGDPRTFVTVFVNLEKIATLPPGCDALLIYETVLRAYDLPSASSIPLSGRTQKCAHENGEMRVGVVKVTRS